MKLLALDTSSEGCSAALLVDGSVTERFEIAPRGHTRLLMPMVRELLSEQGLAPAALDCLAFACGPGSFTGLRIATGVVQGLAYGLDVPVVPVSSLAAVAADAIARHSLAEGDGIAVAFDARMGELYWACYVCRAGQPQLVGDERVCAPGSVELASGITRWSGAGQGWALRESFPAEVVDAMTAIDETLVPRASRVAELAATAFREGAGVSAAEAQPVYIRDEVAWKKLPGR
ncbi:tRNA (adenosine(37)-N6)-threonylcarbamoyltransferase complex dimerization subunit type 1 TsaB [Marinobacter sp. HL-58]|uniref:tRNA (adenosine(37)-N6)-threonylcarbamoyltransferase complex dimerization subunit type 1 TsaB n=1 Tax=Marinobacter sp. HL-58 TaxID=1479237 RepID=UPI000485DB53|nr:tRNA (adenosine(37)-N6)-threonylcarbamoyltransferase complex dimerization subunit type 1 TsaB [Marinobacter sp. HL-58]KPP98095.1 MAG: tRNA threonylcarbamoyladenosine biosynthesis protein TsaB [Marinobacter sp. HL-58]